MPISTKSTSTWAARSSALRDLARSSFATPHPSASTRANSRRTDAPTRQRRRRPAATGRTRGAVAATAPLPPRLGAGLSRARPRPPSQTTKPARPPSRGRGRRLDARARRRLGSSGWVLTAQTVQTWLRQQPGSVAHAPRCTRRSRPAPARTRCATSLSPEKSRCIASETSACQGIPGAGETKNKTSPLQPTAAPEAAATMCMPTQTTHLKSVPMQEVLFDSPGRGYIYQFGEWRVFGF